MNINDLKLGQKIRVQLVDGSWKEATVVNVLKDEPENFVAVKFKLNSYSVYSLKLYTWEPIVETKDILDAASERIKELEVENTRCIARIKQLEEKLDTIRNLVK